MNEILHLIAGAVIGGLIGYCTNFIAIRMLFRPRTEKRSGNSVFRLRRELFRGEKTDWPEKSAGLSHRKCLPMKISGRYFLLTG